MFLSNLGFNSLNCSSEVQISFTENFICGKDVVSAENIELSAENIEPSAENIELSAENIETSAEKMLYLRKS